VDIQPRRPSRVAELLALSDERTLWLRRLLDAERRGYDRGREAGYANGRRDEAVVRDRAWREFSTPIARGAPSFAELEICRYGKGGRAHFADPRPGDYPGGPVPWDGRKAGAA
jgi:hypothetical protein